MNKPKSLIRAASVVLIATLCVSRAQMNAETNAAAWEREAKNVTIIRDNWGVPHVYGKTDADAVFGVIYAQAEDDFNRVETNYLNSMGRLAEAEGEAEIYRDLRMRLFIDPADLKAKYATSPEWLKALMNACADGLNYYLYKHPQVKPRVITQFEPWMALSFTEGSIGGDIEKVNLNQLQAFYGKIPAKQARVEATPVYVEPTGSNGIAIAPSNTAAHHALFLINPHTSFYFRAEAQMVSEAGLNAYGAITWGQFFIYQGFNDRVGWMHTTSAVDNIDEYLETVVKKGDKFYYKYGSEERPIESKKVVVPYKTASGMAQAEFTIYRTQHGPVTREANGKWVSIALMEAPAKALIQSYTRTKAKNYKEFRDTMEGHTNSSNNTVYADADGTIAYFHSNFIPRRDEKFDWSKPVDGSDPATDWKGVLSIDETPGLKNPPNGWLYNTNNSPWSAAGPNSPKQTNFAAYVDRGSENARGIHAVMLLEKKKDFTLDSLLEAAFDSYLPAFKDEIPALVKAWDRASATDPLKTKLAEPIGLLRSWDMRWSAKSIPTSLAVYWGEAAEQRGRTFDKATDEQLLRALSGAVDQLTKDFGTWKTPWGDINRYQRLTGDIAQKYNDAAPSVPVPFTSSRWGSLASFGARTYPGTAKRYGNTGNSFVAAVEFGPQVHAKAVTAGGESGDPKSPHFGDQVTRYASGNLRDVYFYRKELNGHIERQYHPGE
jgi:acyl-homoserine-lactone acylase